MKQCAIKINTLHFTEKLGKLKTNPYMTIKENIFH